jgi:hypothetical protein
MFVIFLLTQPSAIFARCGLLVQSHSFPATAIAPSCCPLPPLSPPPPAPPPPSPSSTIEAAQRRCALQHNLTPQPPSAATVHSCCALSPPAPPMPLSTIEAAHRRCALLHPTPQPPSADTVHSCCEPLLPPPPLPLSHSRRPPCHHPQLLCAVAAAPLPSSKSALPQCNVCRSWYFIKNR